MNVKRALCIVVAAGMLALAGLPWLRSGGRAAKQHGRCEGWTYDYADIR